MTLPRLVSENRNESDGDDGLLYHQPPAIRQMGLRCTVALALLMVLASADLYVLWSQSRPLKSDALVVNVSGRQRLRMSRIGVLILRMLGAQDARERLQLHNELRGAIERFADTHNQLMRGNERLDLPAPPANVRKVLEQQPYEFDRRA
jgi:nitrate/nitrite-specific signal transduction histidine kinase